MQLDRRLAARFRAAVGLVSKIEQFVEAYNKTEAPLKWIAKADSFLDKLQGLCSQSSGTAH